MKLPLLAASVLGLCLSSGPALAGPSLAEQQLEYAKEEYGKGVAAMEAKEYEAAAKHFTEAYRYAPDKHAFNFNIGEASLAAGDCQAARSRYQNFINLAPDHPEVETAKRRLEKTKDCARASSGPVTDSERPELANQEDVAADLAALYAALQTTRHARDLFGRVLEHHKDAAIFPKARKKHARQVKKLLKVIYNRGQSAPEPGWEVAEMPVAGTIKEACAQARDEEQAMRAAYAAAREQVSDKKEIKALKRADKVAAKYEPQFKFCAKN